MAYGDIERQRQRMVANIRSVVTGGAGSLNFLWIAEIGIVIQTAHVGDREGRGVEELLPGGDVRTRGALLRIAFRIVLRVIVDPLPIEIKHVGIEWFAVWILAQRIVNAGVIRLPL